MIPDLAWWGRLLGLLATEAALIVALAVVAARVSRAAQWRRLIWQTAFLAIALVWCLELGGGRDWLTRWRPVPAPPREVTVRVVGESAVHAEPVPFEFPTAMPVSDLPPTPPQPLWWPGTFWLAGFGALWLKALGSRLWLAWRIRAVHEPEVGQAASLPTRSASGRLAACPTLNEAPLAEVAATVARLRKVLGVGPVRLVAWRRLRGPVAFGIFRPTVAVPADFEAGFTPPQREAMLAHELAHLANRDPLWLLVAELVCALAWWHPLMWWARRQFRAACEAAADEASTLVPGGRVALAEALVNFGRELTAPGGVGVAGSGMKSELARRVNALLAGAPAWKRAPAASGWLVRGGAVAVTLAWMLAPNTLAVAPEPLADLVGALAAMEPPEPAGRLQVDANLLLNRLVEQPVGASLEPGPAAPTNSPRLAANVAYEQPAARGVRRAPLSYGWSNGWSTNPAIVLPEFEFPGETLAETASRLRLAAKQADPEGLGITVSSFASLGLEAVRIRPGPTLQHADLSLVLATVVRLAQSPLEASVDNRAVLFSARPRGAGDNDGRLKLLALALKTARIELDEARSRHAVGTPELAAAESRHEAAQLALHAQAKQSQLATRQFRLSAGDFTAHLQSYWPKGETNARALQVAVRAFCATNGVEFPSVFTNTPGATPPLDQPAIFYNDRTGQLFARATLENLERLEHAIQQLNLTAAETDPSRAELVDRLRTTKATLGELLTRYKDGHPKVRAAAKEYFEAKRAVEEPERPPPRAPEVQSSPKPETPPEPEPLPPTPATNAPPLFTRQFRVDPDKFAARVLTGFDAAEEAARRMEALPNRSLIASDVGAAVPSRTPPSVVSKSPRPGFAGGGEGAGPNLQEAARAYFRRQGVAFAPPGANAAAPPPESSTIVYNPNAGILFVHASLEDLAKMEKLLAGLEPPVASTATPGSQVQLAVFFVEMEERGADDLGLDWVFGQPPTNNPAPVTQLLTNLPGSSAALQGDRLRVDRLEVAGQSAVLSGDQFAALRQRLEGRAGVEFLSAPQIISLSDRQAQVSVGDVRTVVTGVVATDGSVTNDADIRYVTDQVSVGPVVDLFPRLEGDAWRVRVVASLNEFLGYDAPGKTNRVEARAPGKRTLRRDLPLPRLRRRETQAEAVAQPGEIIALRGPLAENVIQTKDKVPVLGDVPLLGRLFRRESTQTRRTRLYVFVQPSSVDARGNRVGPAASGDR